MKRITLWAMSTLTLLVLLFSYRTSTQAVSPVGGAPGAVVQQKNPSSVTEAGTAQTTTSGSGGTGGASGSDTASSGSSSSASSTSKAATAKVYTGSSIDTQYGPVQVQVTVTNGQLTKAQAVTYPTQSPRDQQINSVAVPILDQEATSAKSAQIDMVSGATYTSQAYVQSLQSALDAANV